MKIIYNKVLPFGNYKAINLFTIIFAKDICKPLSEKTINHEKIHSKQMIELLFIPFYILYGLEYMIRLVQYKFNTKDAYKNISFEREAYSNENNMEYLHSRKLYNFIRYIKSK